MKDFFNPKGVFTTRNLTVMALMVAFSTILGSFDLYITPSFKLFSFAYLPQAMVSLLYGPLAGLTVGFVADFTNFMVNPMGAYFAGYALSAMVSNVIYAFFLYRKPIRVWRVVASRVLIVIIVTFGLNGIWQVLFFGTQAGNFYTGMRVIRNLIQFPLDVFLITVMGRLVRKLANNPIWQ